MSDPQPEPRVSNRMSPLAAIVVVILIGIVVVAFVKRHGHHVTPSGVSVPMAAASNAVMPRQPSPATTLQPRANTNDAAEAGPGSGNTGQ
jgi:hypothetical protein